MKMANPYRPGGTDIAVADGGTGSSTASGARTNLGLVIGTDVLSPTGTATGLTGLTAGLTTENAKLAPNFTDTTLYWAPLGGSNIGGGTSFGSGNRLYYPMRCDFSRTLTVMTVNVISAAAAGKKMRVGLYARNANSVIGTLAADLGELAIDATGSITGTISYAITPGHYFLAIHMEATATLGSAVSNLNYPIGRILASTTATSPANGSYESKTYGVMDAAGTQTANSAVTVPEIMFR